MGRTKNIYLFTAPWNVLFVPRIIDPLTGHESKGRLQENFQKQFNDLIFSKYSGYIKDYNKIIIGLDIEQKLKDYENNLRTKGIEVKRVKSFMKSARSEFAQITIPDNEPQLDQQVMDEQRGEKEKNG